MSGGAAPAPAARVRRACALGAIVLAAVSFAAAAQYEVGVQALNRGDFVEAWIMLAPLAREGDARAQHDVGVMHALGLGVEASLEEAATWLERAAQQGFVLSQARLGWMYFHGLGVARDPRRAAHWSRRAAEAGNAWAQSNYGYSLDTGEGVPRDPAEAVRWYRLSAEQGFPEGQRNLGAMLESGHGVERDAVAAYAWYGVAAVGGDRPAIALRDRLGARLAPDELDRARQLARELLERVGSHPELGG